MHSLHSSSMPSRLLSKCSNPGMVFMSVSNARRCPDVKFMKLLLSVFGENKKEHIKMCSKTHFTVKCISIERPTVQLNCGSAFLLSFLWDLIFGKIII